MNLFRFSRLLSVLPIMLAVASAQALPSAPVPYASINQLNSINSQLEQASQATQLDLAKLRIEKWKMDSGTKRQLQSNIESIQRNLQSALPEIVGQLRNAPDNLEITFKLYRNLSALYDVFSSVVELAGAFGLKDDFQSLANDLSALDESRRAFGDRTDNLAISKEAELARLRSALLQIQAHPPQAQKTIVDDTQPIKKPMKKKPAPKSTTGSATQPGATTQQVPPKPKQ
jgi:hypothetical protein